MLIFIILCVAFIAGITLLVLDDKFGWSWKHGLVSLLGCALAVLGFFAILISAIWVATVQIPKETDYQNELHLRETLEYRLEHKSENAVGNELLYTDIVQFNNNLRTTKYYANNPWTSWFHNDKIATLDYIEIEEGE